MMRSRVTSLLVLLAVGVIGPGIWVRASGTQVRTLTAAAPAKVVNRAMTPLLDGTRKGVTLDAKPGDGVAYWPDVQFGDGTIDLDIQGKDLQGQSFVGVAFHGADDQTFDVVYFRPFNFKAPAQLNRSHAVQYVSHPTYTWDKLRSEHPDVYEHEIAPVPDPNGWFRARVVVAHPSVKVYVNNSTTPTMEVKQLSTRKTGWVGVWVGNASGGSFANVRITP
jgi:hypothetical protein